MRFDELQYLLTIYLGIENNKCLRIFLSLYMDRWLNIMLPNIQKIKYKYTKYTNEWSELKWLNMTLTTFCDFKVNNKHKSTINNKGWKLICL